MTGSLLEALRRLQNYAAGWTDTARREDVIAALKRIEELERDLGHAYTYYRETSEGRSGGV